MKLAEKFKHPRDEHVGEHADYADNHIYLINGVEHPELGYKSVTTFIKQFFEEFNPDEIIEKYYDGWQRRKHEKYYQKTPEEIKEMWQAKGTEAAELGTYMHAQFENYLNGEKCDMTIPEMHTFMKWLDEQQLMPYRTEMTIYSEKYKLVGNVDFIAIDKRGDFVIIDFKRADPPKDADFGKRCKPPLKLPHTDETKHVLQLNIYRQILEEEYGMIIGGLYNLYIKDDKLAYRKRLKFAEMSKLLQPI